ncbi:MAG: Ig-like domain-containing protein [Nitrospirota bacterium]
MKGIAWLMVMMQILFLLSPEVTGLSAPARAASLSIADGVTVKGNAGSQIVVRDTLNAGKAAMTSQKPAPAPGDWKGIKVERSAAGTQFKGTLLEYCGAEGSAGLEVRHNAPQIREVDVRNNSGAGIRLTDAASPVIQDSMITDNAQGIVTETGSKPSITNSILSGNITAVLNLDPGQTLTAAGNWWGHPTGPQDTSDDRPSGLYNPGGLGNPVSDGVNYSSWAAAIPILGSSFSIAEGSLTKTSEVTLNLGCLTCTEFRVSENSSFTGAVFQPLVPSFPYTLSSGDALKTLYVQYRASTGNTSAPLSAQIRLDTAGPVASVTNPANNAVVRRPATLSASATDPAGVRNVEFYVDGTLLCSDASTPFSCSWDIASVLDGGHTILVRAYDTLNHISEVAVPVSVAKTPPQAPAITSPINGTVLNTTATNILGSAEPGSTVSLYINNIFAGQVTANQMGLFQFFNVAVSEGTNYLSATASDSIGTSPLCQAVALTIDTGAPTAPTIYGSGALAGGKIKVDWAPGAGEVPTAYRVYRSTTLFSSTAQATLAYNNLGTLTITDTPALDGTYFYGITALDGAGNESPLSNIVSEQADRTAPTAAVHFTPSSPVGPGTIGVQLITSEPLATAPYLGLAPAGLTPTPIDLAQVSPTEWSGSFAVSAATPHGTAVLSFSAKDGMGNKGTQITAGSSIMIDTRGPSGSVQVTPSQSIYKTGAVSVGLTLNEAAAQTPVLQFRGPSGSLAAVTLSGSGASWSGTLDITQAMGDGNGVFVLQSLDNLGNIGSDVVSGGSLSLDVTPPTAPTALAAASKPEGRISLAWDAGQDAHSYRVYRVPSTDPLQLPAAPVASALSVKSYLDLPAADGSYRYAVTAIDQAGNESALSGSVTALSDRAAPTPPTGLALSLVDSNVQATWNAPIGEAALNYNLYRSTSPVLSVAGMTPVKKGIIQQSSSDVPPADAHYYYAVTALDGSGNESQPSGTVMIVYDLAPPVINVAGVADGQFVSGAVTPTVTISDASLESTTLTLDGMPYTSGAPIGGEGAHLLHIEAKDTAQRTTTRNIQFTIDLTDPQVDIANVIGGVHYTAPVTPAVTVFDQNLETTAVLLDGAPYQAGTVIGSDGSHTLIVTARDKAGRTKTASVAFTMDVASPPPSNLSIVATQQGPALLTWGGPASGDVAGYHVYKNGQRLTGSPLAAHTFKDDFYSNTAPVLYAITTVDTTGNESAPLQATVIPLEVALTGYGRLYGSDVRMSKHYIESIRAEVRNRHAAATTVGPLTFEIRDHVGTIAELTQAGTVSLPSGDATTLEKIVPVGTGIVDYRILTISAALPGQANTSVKYVASFNLNAFDPGRKVEVVNDPLIKGGMAKVRLSIYNHGSVPIEVLTALGGNPSPEVYVLLKDSDGNILAKGNLKHDGIGVLNYSGYSLAEIQPGGSFLSKPVEFVVPSNIPDRVYLEAFVSKIYYHYNKPEQVTGEALSGYSMVTVSNASYYATVSAEHSVYDQDTPVVLNGEARDTLTGAPAAHVPVKIGIGVKGFDRYLSATTDLFGKFSVTFTPVAGEAGIYRAWATHPSVYDKPVQSTFTIHGASFDPRTVNLRMSKNSSFTMPVSLKNLGETALTAVQLSVAGGAGVAGTLDKDSLDALAGGSSAGLRITMTAAFDAPDTSSATVTMTTTEGITRTLNFNIELLPALPTIDTDPDFLEVGVNRNNLKVVTFKLRNVGLAPLENIRIQPPSLPWIGMATATEIASLAQGESTDISVIFRPADAVAQGTHSDKLIIMSDNHVPYTMNIFTTVTATERGSVHFKAVDALNELVKGASIITGHQVLSGVILTGHTDTNGEIEFANIPIGLYNYKITAPGHEVVTGTFEVLPDGVTPVDVFMNNVFVTYEWSVTPMTITDNYEIKLEATFETQVPAPVLTIEPAYQSLELEIGSTYIGEYIVKNHGLVAIDDVKITPAFGPGLSVEVLVTELPRIGAGETVVIPYRITVNPFKSPEPVNPCSDIPVQINVGGGYYCLFGTWTGSGVTASTMVKPKDRYDPLGLCDTECDWCNCLVHPTAASLCKCLKTRDICTCSGLFGNDVADAVCDCAKTFGGDANALIGCAEKVVGGAAISGLKAAASLLDAFKNGFSCGLCLQKLLPSLPTLSTSASGGSGGGGSWGGYGSPGGGGFSVGGGCR